jgi:hypothetical protein
VAASQGVKVPPAAHCNLSGASARTSVEPQIPASGCSFRRSQRADKAPGVGSASLFRSQKARQPRSADNDFRIALFAAAKPRFSRRASSTVGAPGSAPSSSSLSGAGCPTSAAMDLQPSNSCRASSCLGLLSATTTHPGARSSRDRARRQARVCFKPPWFTRITAQWAGARRDMLPSILMKPSCGKPLGTDSA